MSLGMDGRAGRPAEGGREEAWDPSSLGNTFWLEREGRARDWKGFALGHTANQTWVLKEVGSMEGKT